MANPHRMYRQQAKRQRQAAETEAANQAAAERQAIAKLRTEIGLLLPQVVARLEAREWRGGRLITVDPSSGLIKRKKQVACWVVCAISPPTQPERSQMRITYFVTAKARLVRQNVISDFAASSDWAQGFVDIQTDTFAEKHLSEIRDGLTRLLTFS